MIVVNILCQMNKFMDKYFMNIHFIKVFMKQNVLLILELYRLMIIC